MLGLRHRVAIGCRDELSLTRDRAEDVGRPVMDLRTGYASRGDRHAAHPINHRR